MATDDTITLSGTPTHDAADAGANTVIPRRLGHVSLIRELGRGGMGSVWLGRDEMLGRDVAVKFLLNAVTDADDPGFARFLEGARAAATLRHPGLTAIHAAELINGVPYQVMEFVDGPTVAAVLERHGPLAPSVAHAIIDSVADAIGTLHERGIVHRDIKPSNVLLDADGGVFVTDFGLTCRRAGPESKTQVAGTPAYMAPEIFDGQVSPKSDVYALGVMLYEMLTGERPFRGAAGSGTHRPEREAMPRGPLAARGLPEALTDVIERAVHVNPLFRHKSAATFRQAVDDAMGSRPDAIRDARAIASLALPAGGRSEAVQADAKTPGESTPTYFDSLSQIAARKRGEVPGGERGISASPTPQRDDESIVLLGERLSETRCIPCIKCGYDLRGQEIRSRCPECGAAIVESAVPDRLVFSSMTWLNKVTLGLKLIRHGFSLGLLLFLLPFGLFISGININDKVAWWIMVAILGGATICPVVGVWMATTPDPGEPLSSREMRRAWVARGAMFLFSASAWAFYYLGRSNSLAVAVSQSIVLGTAFLAGTLFFGMAISRIVARIPDSKESRRLRNSSIVVGVLLCVAPALVLLRPWLGRPASGASFFIFCGTLWYVSRLSVYERAVQQVVKLRRGD